MSEQQPRPGQATLAGVLIIGGSVVLIMSAWQRISTLHTLAVQEELQRMLGDSGDLGIGVDQMATVIRVLCLIGAGAAAAAAILGFQVFQRSSSARVALSILSPFLLIGGLATAGFLAPMVVAGIALLWMRPTRDWYAGRPWTPRVGPRPGASGASDATTSGGPASGGPASPARDSDESTSGVPAAPPGSAPQASAPWPVAPTGPGATGPGASGPGASGPSSSRVRGPRPRPLVTASVLSWLLCGLAVVAMGMSMVALAVEGDALFADLREQQPDLVASSGMSEQGFVVAAIVVFGCFAVWAVLAIVLAVLTFLGHNWARITLVVSGVLASLVVLFSALSAPPLVFVAGAIGVTVWLLLRRDVADWFRPPV